MKAHSIWIKFNLSVWPHFQTGLMHILKCFKFTHLFLVWRSIKIKDPGFFPLVSQFHPLPLPDTGDGSLVLTLRSLGHTFCLISSVRSPPSLIAMRLRAATSVGSLFRAWSISATFFFLLALKSAKKVVDTYSACVHFLFRAQSSFQSELQVGTFKTNLQIFN